MRIQLVLYSVSDLPGSISIAARQMYIVSLTCIFYIREAASMDYCVKELSFSLIWTDNTDSTGGVTFVIKFVTYFSLPFYKLSSLAVLSLKCNYPHVS